MEVDGVSPGISEAVLAHVNPGQTVRAYARSDLLGRCREHMQRWADYVFPLEAAGD